MSGVVTVSRALTPRNWTSTSDPTNGWDAADGVRVGDHWYNTTSGNVFVCVSNTVGAAVWRHIPRAWSSTGDATGITGTTAETVAATLSLPAGVMGSNGTFEIIMNWEQTNNANGKTARYRFGAAGAGTGGTSLRAIAIASTAVSLDFSTFQNRNATNSQRMMGAASAGVSLGTGTGSGGPTAAIDTTAATEIAFTGTLVTSTDTMTLKSWTVKLFRPDIT